MLVNQQTNYNFQTIIVIYNAAKLCNAFYSSHKQQDFPPNEEQQDPFAMREEPPTAILLLLTSNRSTSRKPLIVGHTGVASPRASWQGLDGEVWSKPALKEKLGG